MNSQHIASILRVQSLVIGVLVVLDCMYTMYASSDINGIENAVGKTAECQVTKLNRRSVSVVGRYLEINIRCTFLIYIKLQYTTTLWYQRCQMWQMFTII